MGFTLKEKVIFLDYPNNNIIKNPEIVAVKFFESQGFKTLSEIDFHLKYQEEYLQMLKNCFQLLDDHIKSKKSSKSYFAGNKDHNFCYGEILVNHIKRNDFFFSKCSTPIKELKRREKEIIDLKNKIKTIKNLFDKNKNLKDTPNIKIFVTKEKYGCSGGFPDLYVYNPKTLKGFFVEVKSTDPISSYQKYFFYIIFSKRISEGYVLRILPKSWKDKSKYEDKRINLNLREIKQELVLSLLRGKGSEGFGKMSKQTVIRIAKFKWKNDKSIIKFIKSIKPAK